MPESVVFDIEADGLKPSKIHCLSTMIDGEIYSMTDYDDMRRFFESFDVYIGHNIIGFDIPVCERILGIKIDKKFIDTLYVSWYLYPERPLHGLESWGETFNKPKPVITDWENLSVEEYINRCQEDVSINTTLWDQSLTLLLHLYPKPKDFWRFIDYLSFKADCIREQEEEKWKLDVEYCTHWLQEFKTLREQKLESLRTHMPKVPVFSTRKRPKIVYKRDNSMTSKARDYLELCISLGHKYNGDYNNDLPESVDIKTGEQEPNPGSTHQIKDWLFSLGWVPRTFKYAEDKRAIPQINKPFGEGLCESIKELFDIQPCLEELDGYYVLRHREGLLKGFLRDQDNGYLKASVAGLTNTLRFIHREIVNLPKVNTKFGEPVRGSLIVDDGLELCGSDMVSLEDRLKQHYIWPYDPEYVKTMLEPGFDPHLDLAFTGGVLTKQDVENYKNGDKSKKKIRDIFKNGNYACQYLAGPPKLAQTANISLEEAKKLHKTYWERNWAVKEVTKDQIVASIQDQMWLLNPVSGFYYSLRNEKDIFSTLVQGTASYVFDLWLGFLRQKGVRITGQFHDEKISKHKTEDKEKVTQIHREAIQETNEVLNLNRELDIDIQWGIRYSNIH